MSRMKYETALDLKNETAAIRMLEFVSKRHARKLPVSYRIDFAMVDEEDHVTSWVEVKCRKNPKSKYPTFAIGITKLMAGISFEEKTGKPFVLVVQWSDFLGYVRISSLKGYMIAYGGRKDRMDPADEEPMVHIPIDNFKQLKKEGE